MANALSLAGPNVLVDTGARLLTPAVREIYAVLVRVGVLVVHD